MYILMWVDLHIRGVRYVDMGVGRSNDQTYAMSVIT